MNGGGLNGQDAIIILSVFFLTNNNPLKNTTLFPPFVLTINLSGKYHHYPQPDDKDYF